MAPVAIIVAVVAAVAAIVALPIRVGGVGAGQAEADNAGEKERFPELHDIEPPSSSARYGCRIVAKPGRQKGKNKALASSRRFVPICRFL
jgi:hypothetical protein